MSNTSKIKKLDSVITENQYGKMMRVYNDKQELIKESFIPSNYAIAEGLTGERAVERFKEIESGITTVSTSCKGRAKPGGAVKGTGENRFLTNADLKLLQEEIKTEKVVNKPKRDAKGRFTKASTPTITTLGELADANAKLYIADKEPVPTPSLTDQVADILEKSACRKILTKPSLSFGQRLWSFFKMDALAAFLKRLNVNNK